MKKCFYDVHCHAMNLSHPNLLAFIKRLIPDINEGILGRYWVKRIVILILLLLLCPLLILLYMASQRLRFVNRFINRLPELLGLSKIVNLLSLMENNLGDYFLLMEKDVLHFRKKKSRKIKIGCEEYDKIILTPLIMDFGYKWVGTFPNIHYKKLSSKPVIDQVKDVFNGIKKYRDESRHKLLEIYPFLGINAQNYYLDDETHEIIEQEPDLNLLKKPIRDKIEIMERKQKNKTVYKFIFFGEMSKKEKKKILKLFIGPKDKEKIRTIYRESQDIDKRNTVLKMLKKYFSEYSSDYSDLKKNLGQFNGDIENMGSNFFAGIKVYPPLGFNPWPDEKYDWIEYKKVYQLYEFCVKRGIPVTTHCSKGGFRVIDKDLSREYARPSTWRKVLDAFPRLKLNFAHFGGEGKLVKDDWAKEIIDLILDNDFPNVYTDISDLYPHSDGYAELHRLFESVEDGADRKKLMKKVLFGTDFMINLRKSESYKEYLLSFSQTEFLKDCKVLLGSENPGRFVFSKSG